MSEPSGNAFVLSMLSEHGGSASTTTAPIEDFRSDSAVQERARQYVAKMPGAVSGENGHGVTFRVACVLAKGFQLPENEAWQVLLEFNQRCEPPWTEHELRHKLNSAMKASGSAGYLRNASPARWGNIGIPEYREPKSTEKTVSKGNKPQRSSLKDVVAKAVEHSATGVDHLVKIGLPDLNRALGGGVEFGEMIMVAARPSHGKSMLALQMVAQLTADGISCGFISEEMAALTVGKRVIQFASDMPEPTWMTDRDRLNHQIGEYFRHRAECTIVEGCRTIERVVDEIRELAESGVKAIVVDYVQLLQSSTKGRYETVTENSVQLRKVCTETGIILIVLAQMSRSIEGRELFVPRPSDLRESGQLEQDTDVLLFLVWPWKIDPEKERNEYLIFVQKNRNREIVSPVIKCRFDPARQRITGLVPDHYEWLES